MHEPRQLLRIARITPVNEWVSCFRLESAENSDSGTNACSQRNEHVQENDCSQTNDCSQINGKPLKIHKPLMPFTPGQYINIFYEIGGTKTSRPYSIASSPFDAQNGYYELFIHNGGPFTARWLFKNGREGDVLTCSSPVGNFCFDPEKDTRKVIAISGGMSVTPLRSMARAVADGTLDIDLTIISGWDYKNELLFREDFEDCARRCHRFKSVFTVAFDENADEDTGTDTASEKGSAIGTANANTGTGMFADADPESETGMCAGRTSAKTGTDVCACTSSAGTGTGICAGTVPESGYGADCNTEDSEPCADMSKDLVTEAGYCDGAMILRHCNIEDATFFLCGPQEMYDALLPELERMGIPRHRIHREIPGELQTPVGQPDYPGAASRSFTLTFIANGVRHDVPASAHETLLVALERAGIPTDARCRCGCCPHCEGRLITGDVYIPAIRDFRTPDQKARNLFHLCCAFPLSDVEVGEIEPQKGEKTG